VTRFGGGSGAPGERDLSLWALLAQARRPPPAPDLFAEAAVVVFECVTACEIAAPPGARVMRCRLWPVGEPVVERFELALSGRTAPAAPRRVHRRAKRSWSRASVLLDGATAWVPADVWTPRIFREVGRRLYMQACGTGGAALPRFEYPNAWPLPRGDDLAAALAHMLADAEDIAFECWTLSRAGRRLFERFGRDPAVPLGPS
jgi:hypothetical protein